MSVVPEEKDLVNAIRKLQAADPELGVKRVTSTLKEENATWSINAKRVLKIMRKHNLTDAARLVSPSHSPTRTSAATPSDAGSLGDAEEAFKRDAAARAEEVVLEKAPTRGRSTTPPVEKQAKVTEAVAAPEQPAQPTPPVAVSASEPVKSLPEQMADVIKTTEQLQKEAVDCDLGCSIS